MTEDIKNGYIARINEVLDYVRPYLQADGGDIDFLDLNDDLTVVVNLTGACHSCPMSIQTLKFGVESALKSAIPEIKEVLAV
jgi:Fe-S cluster biogenesis protein NfuA